MLQSPTITILVGPPGSGKSTLAHHRINFDGDHGAATVRISQDDQGKTGHMDLFEKALHFKQDIIVDRMNFDKNQRNRYLEPARKAGYATRIIVFHVPLRTCIERCNARTDHPTIKDSKSASEAVNFFFKNYERVSDDEANEVFRMGWADINAPKAIVCDLDGTLCDVTHRRHHVRPVDPTELDLPSARAYLEDEKKPFKKNWKAFFDGIPHDRLNTWCAEILHTMKASHPIILCSGRDDNQRKMTVDWLEKHEIQYDALFMRGRGDSRRDDVVKEIILDFEILTRYNVYFTIDDRDQVVKMWRKRGLVCLQCDFGDF